VYIVHIFYVAVISAILILNNLKGFTDKLYYYTFILQYNCLVAILPATSVISILRKTFIRRHSAIRTVFDDASDVAHLISTKFCVIKDGMRVLLSVYNKTNDSNSGVLAYKVNPLMLVVAANETCRNVEWLHKNFRIIKYVVLTVGNLYTDTVAYARMNTIDSRTLFVIASFLSSIHWNIFI